VVGFVKDPDGIWLELYKEGEQSGHPLTRAKANHSAGALRSSRRQSRCPAGGPAWIQIRTHTTT